MMAIPNQPRSVRDADYSQILFRRHAQGALVRSGASLFMWVCALIAFLEGHIRKDQMAGISASVAFLILMNPPSLWLLKRMTQINLCRYLSLIINILEIIGYTSIIYFLGGIEATYLIPIYSLLIAYVGVVAPRKLPFIIAGICSIAFALIVVLEYLGFLPGQFHAMGFYFPWGNQFDILFVIAALLFMGAFIASYTGNLLKENREKLRRQNVELVQAKEAAEKARDEFEQRVKERTFELMIANEQLHQKTEDLIRSNKELEQFAYVASHDLQEPLRMVTSYVQLLSQRYKDKLDQDANEFIDFAADGATRMYQLINDLLAYSRVGTQGNLFELVDCEEVFHKSVNNLKVAVEESGAEVTHDPLPKTVADFSELEQLFQNLIGNAIKFRGEESPRVHISARPNGDYWVFSVRDNGIGIAPEYKERIFVIFQRLHGKDKYPGTGIGLAICKKIVERHGGRIWVESEPEKGATFYFTLPKEGVQQTRPLEQ
jgi:signal transduction histidine kinase